MQFTCIDLKPVAILVEISLKHTKIDYAINYRFHKYTFISMYE